MRPAVICFAILLFCVGTVQEDAVVEEMEFDEQLENMHEGLENFDETEGAHTDAGVLARAEGQFVAGQLSVDARTVRYPRLTDCLRGTRGGR